MTEDQDGEWIDESTYKYGDGTEIKVQSADPEPSKWWIDSCDHSDTGTDLDHDYLDVEPGEATVGYDPDAPTPFSSEEGDGSADETELFKDKHADEIRDSSGKDLPDPAATTFYENETPRRKFKWGYGSGPRWDVQMGVDANNYAGERESGLKTNRREQADHANIDAALHGLGLSRTQRESVRSKALSIDISNGFRRWYGGLIGLALSLAALEYTVDPDPFEKQVRWLRRDSDPFPVIERFYDRTPVEPPEKYKRMVAYSPNKYIRHMMKAKLEAARENMTRNRSVPTLNPEKLVEAVKSLEA